MSDPVEPVNVDVLIVGAGISGIGMAWHLQQKCPGLSYTILEAREAIGGTWDRFQYPGIRSDSDMYTFGFAFRPWTAGGAFADGPAIREYVRATATDNGIDQHIRFGHRVASADFDTKTARWHVETERGEVFSARFLTMCSGYYRYDRGYEPTFPGAEDFAGTIVHPQQWDPAFDYANKRVIIIGSGATAVTMVPAMAEGAAHVTMLQRSPSFIAAQPSRDTIAQFLKAVLPAGLAHRTTRMKNVLRAIFFYELSQRFPEFVKNGVL
ncbi:MAG: monooxygenase, partial [Thalassolituus oleivorans]